MNLSQLRLYAIRPVLQNLQLWSPSAENLILGTGLKESSYEYLDQLDHAGAPGPAYGFWQMEEFTYLDIWNTFLSNRPLLRKSIRDLAGFPDRAVPQVTDLHTNLALAIAMCRVKYMRASEPLPVASSAAELAIYWKTHYNTAQGAGDWSSAILLFQRAIEA